MSQPQDSLALGQPTSNGQGSPEDAAAVMEQIRSGEITTVVVGGCDWNGVFRAKRIPAERFAKSEQPSVEFSEYLWAMDIDDYPQPRPDGYEGWWPEWATGFGDVEAFADLSTLRRVPWLEGTALALCDYKFSDGRDYEVAPRNVLKRVVERCEALGLQARFAPELEFFIYKETEQSAIAKGFRDLEPLSVKPLAYGALQATIDSSVVGEMAGQLHEMRVPVEAWAPEGGPGQYELNLPHSPALEAADLGFLFKHGVKEFCALRGMLATFMPKLAHGDFGSSMHVHQSVWKDGESAFYDAGCEDGMSQLLRQYVAGQIETLIPFAPLFLPTPPAYKRGEDYSAAATTVSWGGDNKTLAVRVLAHGGSRCRVEHRVPGADANVYLVIAGLLAGGLHGIENELEPPAATVGDAYAQSDLQRTPKSLEEAIGGFEQSPVANEYLGEEFVRRFAATRRWEIELARQEVTDWELKRYFVRI